MDIESILSSLGLDLTNPEVKRGAIEAIDAILGSRQPTMPLGDLDMSGGGQEEDIEIDPDLLQPSVKNKPQGSDADIDINDEEDILKDVKHNESENEPESQASNDTETGNSDNESESSGSDDSQSSSTNDSKSADGQDGGDSSENDLSDTSNDSDISAESASENTTDQETLNKAEETESGNTDEYDFGFDGDDEAEQNEESDADTADGNMDGSETASGGESEDEDTESEEDTFDEDDLLDTELKDPYEDQAERSKHEARRIKRERTIQAAEKHLADAIAKNKSATLIRELEKALEALKELQEAAKNLKDLSDEEFNRMVNRVFDAIDALGDSELTYTSEEERQIKAQEIKTDLEDRQTQAELSAEDVAKIRAETQAIKAREKEAAKYQRPARGSFKGFQDFLNSLYKAIALQVKTAEARDDSWSAINRRYSRTSILWPGKKVNELPNKKIPVIDFYFDQSGSWGPKDIEIGNKAVEALVDLEKDGKIKINLYYFGDYVSTDPNQTGGGTSGWNEIVRNIIATQATNVVIMTDDDMEDYWRPTDQPPLRYTVPGGVWYLWKHGQSAPRLPRDLKGRGGVQQFSFSSGDV